MIGHRMWATLSQLGHETWGTLRWQDLGKLTGLPGINADRAVFGLDVTDVAALAGTLARVRPDVVLNAVGVVKQLEKSKDQVTTVGLNALYPHQLTKICAQQGARLIHFSTDCVFSGAKGSYTEADPADATDLYGRAKALGEIDYAPHVLTLRTSTIGREINPHGGLLEWFLGNSGGEVRGFRRAIYSGFPAHTLAKVIHEHVLPRPDLHGVLHVASEAIDKYSLLNLINDIVGARVAIKPEDTFAVERSLDAKRFCSLTNYRPLAWADMINDIRIDWDFYEKLRRHA